LTTWTNTGEVLPEKPGLPRYTAVIDCVPAWNVDVPKVAAPSMSVPFPKCKVPLTNETVPAGVPEMLLTVAVNVTASPAIEGFGDEVTAVVVAAIARASGVAMNTDSATAPNPFTARLSIDGADMRASPFMT
jgi:hypothetical protein